MCCVPTRPPRPHASHAARSYLFWRRAEDWTRGLESLLDGPSPAVLTTYRQDGTAVASPVWFRYHHGAFEVVTQRTTSSCVTLLVDPTARWSCSRPFRRSAAYASRASPASIP